MRQGPVTFSSPVDPASYTWEATDEGVAERYGVPVDRIVRFDLNTSPMPPRLLAEMLADGRFAPGLSEYPPGDYRRLVEAAATAYGVGIDEVVPGAGADEIIDMAAKAFLPPGRAAVVPIPSFAMYRVATEQRGGTVIPVPRLGAEAGFALDEPAMRAAAANASLVWLCNPNNPTGFAEPAGGTERLLEAIAADAAAEVREPAWVVMDEAYAEFSGETALPLRTRFPNLVIIRTASKAYALAGLRVGFAIAAPATQAKIARYRPPGSITTISEAVVTRALLDGTEMRENVARVHREGPRLSEGLRAVGWRPYPSVTNFILVDFGTAERAAAVADRLLPRGLVPRTFGASHPLAHCLRLTIRSPHENDRLIEAARAIAQEVSA
jgi:histidinol-phosphate aminotransferase